MRKPESIMNPADASTHLMPTAPFSRTPMPADGAWSGNCGADASAALSDYNPSMPAPLKEKITLSHLRNARRDNKKLPILTCYDFSMVRLMHGAGLPAILVGDSASNVILGHDTTLPITLDFLIDITAAVRRGAPLTFLIGDMPFRSYQASTEQALLNTFRMIKTTNCDAVKFEATEEHAPLVRALSAAGAAVIAHLGLRPQSVNALGGYRF